ncbi:MAG: NADH:ubiquinone reductase (Na(+)-transporting) subunit F, partial [Acidobacteria bacterium]|nr:NADH:ubiquinone reductase (Na(+)-transporting) subunit F [Acidobacteriota bacterium]
HLLLGVEEAVRFDHGRWTYALYRDAERRLFASDGICTHGNTHLGDGLVKGGLIECPKHNGRYRLADGSPARAPVCQGVRTYPIESRDGRLFLNLLRPGGAGRRKEKTIELGVVSNRSVATFIRELLLEPLHKAERIDFTPGDYLRFEIPAYGEIRFSDLDIPEPYASVWKAHHLLDLVASNARTVRRNNYSMACNPRTESLLRFNVRIALPPPGQDCPPGAGSAYMFQLKPGDTVRALGPCGDFHIKPTQKEMVYIGGGSGMAPLRAHISHLFESAGTARRVSFWYGARSAQELFYQEYFMDLAGRFPNFHFRAALSAPLPEDNWTGPRGLIHDVVYDQLLKAHANPRAVEYYLCGPPQMVAACQRMLAGPGVPAAHVAYDEF